jgi:hypothetical protein
MGMPVEEFVEEAYSGLVKGDENVDVGLPGPTSKEDYHALVVTRQKIFNSLSDVLMAHFH